MSERIEIRDWYQDADTNKGGKMMIRAEYYGQDKKPLGKTYFSELTLRACGLDGSMWKMAARCRCTGKAESFRFTFINEPCPFYCGSFD